MSNGTQLAGYHGTQAHHNIVSHTYALLVVGESQGVLATIDNLDPPVTVLV